MPGTVNSSVDKQLSAVVVVCRRGSGLSFMIKTCLSHLPSLSAGACVRGWGRGSGCRAEGQRDVMGNTPTNLCCSRTTNQPPLRRSWSKAKGRAADRGGTIRARTDTVDATNRALVKAA